ncbi:MAG: nitrate reductase subunit alpha [Candidatus Melainabacteria bacterium]|nr:nitrate reductase subunit alpha [Candidatus Melainabacteria bacterium]
MKTLLKKLKFFRRKNKSFSDNHGITVSQNRDWEDSYRQRWQHDKVVRSTHGVNCTGSCSWKIYVKNGLVTWETQATDYPRNRPDMPDHEPRGCARGASYSWYLYSAARLKHPLVRGRLIRLWREARRTLAPVEAWASIVEDAAKTSHYKAGRGQGGFVRVDWQEANEIIAAANIYTAKKHGPDRIIGFSPIPAMSMVSYAAGSRYLSLIGGVLMSFYDWYCDLPPASPQTWGEQTDVPESSDWYNSSYLMLWGSNVPLTRTPDAHFATEARYRGAKVVAVSPDYAESTKLADIWLHPRQGTDAAMALAMGHVILKECYVERQSEYFTKYARENTDMPYLVMLDKHGETYTAGRFLRASDCIDDLNQANNADWKTVAFDETTGDLVVPNGSVGFRWGENGQWNLAQRTAGSQPVSLRLSVMDGRDTELPVAFPYFGAHGKEALARLVPVKQLTLKDGTEVAVATVFDLLAANYGIDRSLGGANVANGLDDENAPYTPAWQEGITGVPRKHVIKVARQFADNAEKTCGRSMVILGAGLNHWYHMDMTYRAIMQMLIMSGCIGQSGGGWGHYVGQEKVRPQSGFTPIAFALDWSRPPRQMNSTSFFYSHTGQWRYETLKVSDLLSPLADKSEFKGAMIDFNVRAERMGWLPSAPQLQANPLEVAGLAEKEGLSAAQYIARHLKDGSLKLACQDPDNPKNFPRNMFIWRSNLLGASGKGHEYFLKYLIGAKNGVQGRDLGERGEEKPREVIWRDSPAEGRLDLLVTLDFRMSTTCLYSDIVLPTATWYEKNDLNTSDMHPFIHPLSKAVDPAWEAKSDWEIYKGIAREFSRLSPGHLGLEKDVVLVPILHDSKDELAQPLSVKDWGKGECEPVPGKTMANIAVVERDYPQTYKKFTAIGPLLKRLGNGGKGLVWNTAPEVELIGQINGLVTDSGVSEGMPLMETDIQAAEAILTFAPETNGQVAARAWRSLNGFTGLDHLHLAEGREEDRIRFRDLQAQPRKIISSPIWSGLESDKVSYNAGYTNVHERIPWRTLTGRQQLYQDHQWMRAFGEGLCVYKPPVDTNSVSDLFERKPNGNTELVLNFITPHQKWGIHSTYSDNLLMLTLSRGGPVVWLSEKDAASASIKDNDWVEVFNVNGALSARAIVSQRIPEGMAMMYHAQEKNVNVPGSETTGTRGIHNSVSRIVMKPTHMIGGYAQLSWGFNYYGTVGSNRDEFVIVRKMSRVDWLDGESRHA